MTAPDWVRWYPDKWLAGVLHLNNEQRGVYIQVITVLMGKGECSADSAYLGKLCGCNRQKAKRIVGELIRLGKVSELDGLLHQERAQTERVLAKKLTQTGQELVAKRWENGHLGSTAPYIHARAHVLTKTKILDKTKDKKDAQAQAHTAEFDTGFWPTYPHKKAKPRALAAFLAARRKHSLETIMGGLQRYIDNKPADRSWQNPATFLNGQTWADDYTTDQQLTMTGNGHDKQPRNQRPSVVDSVRRREARREYDLQGVGEDAPRGEAGEPERR